MLIHEPEMERAVLGSMMWGESPVDAGLELSVDDFALDSHRRIFTCMLSMRAQGLGLDLLTLMAAMKCNDLHDIGGPAYLASLTEGIPRRFNPTDHIRILRKRTQSRRILMICDTARTSTLDGDDPEEVLATLQGEIATSGVNMTEGQPEHIREWVAPTINELLEERKRTGAVLGIPTGIANLDLATTGWRDGELCYVGAIPGRGKTAFLLQCLHAAVTAGYPAGLISLEMRKGQLMRRLAVLRSGLSAMKMREPRTMSEEEFRKAKNTLIELGELPVTATDISGLSPAKIARCARQMYEKGARIIFVDFVQIIREDGRDRREAINRVSAVLRDTSKELNIPFVVASQLARRDADPNRKPGMQDLRESGNLEQDAHRVLLLYRPMDKASGEYTGEDEIIIAKQREGVEGHVDVRYDSKGLRFVERQLTGNS